MNQYLITIEKELIHDPKNTHPETYYKLTLTDQFKRITKVWDGQSLVEVTLYAHTYIFTENT